jgi:hypothetical protein
MHGVLATSSLVGVIISTDLYDSQQSRDGFLPGAYCLAGYHPKCFWPLSGNGL